MYSEAFWLQLLGHKEYTTVYTTATPTFEGGVLFEDSQTNARLETILKKCHSVGVTVTK
jgi:hypothetical protein